MAVSIIETIKSRANAGNTAYIVVVKLLCDDYSDLPAQSGLSGYELAQGCIAHVINENKDYMIDSSGNWHVYGGDSWTNVYTKSETDALLDDKQDELTTAQLDAVNSGITAEKLTADEAALVEVVNAGAKNHALETDKTETRICFIDVRPITGTYRFVIGQYTSTDTDTNNFVIIFDYSDGTNETRYYPKNADIDYEYTTNKYLNRIRIYASASYNQSDGDTVSVSNLMICTEADWAVSQKFVPYAPTNRELYEMIQALQSN